MLRESWQFGERTDRQILRHIELLSEPKRNLQFQFDMHEFLLRCATFISFCEFYFFHKSVEYDVARSESYF